MAAGFTVTFINTAGNQKFNKMTAASNTLLPVSAINVAETVAGGATVTAGTYTLTFNGHTTTTLAWNATPATVQAALEALPGVGAGNVLVTGTAGGDMQFTFRNALGNTDVAPGLGADLQWRPRRGWPPCLRAKPRRAWGAKCKRSPSSA